VNNDYLVQMQHELAMRYNDTSPLENMHCACLFEIVRDPTKNIFANLPRDRFKEVRAMCIEIILHTDNHHHLALLKSLQMWSEINRELLDRAGQAFRDSHAQLADPWPSTAHREAPSSQAASSQPEEVWPTQELQDSMWEPDTRRMLRNVLLHFTDNSNAMKPFSLSREWALRMHDEFFAQGELERLNGLPVQPLNDRSKTNVPFSQVSFIEFFAAPLTFATIRVLPPIQDRVGILIDNAHQWLDEWACQENTSDEEVQHVQARLERLKKKADSLMPGMEKQFSSAGVTPAAAAAAKRKMSWFSA
jgi:hypothetical protein